jgi:hypothetical protein
MPAERIRLQPTALWRVAAVALGAVLATAACTASTPAPAPEQTRTSAPPSPAVSPSPPSPAQQALAAYTAMWGDVQAAGETSDYQDPRLSAHLGGQALLTTSENMAADKADGIIGLGRPDLSGTSVVTATATTVTLHGCMNDEHWLKYYAATRTLVDNVPGGRHYVAATLTDENGTWKVTSLDVRGEGTCV